MSCFHLKCVSLERRHGPHTALQGGTRNALVAQLRSDPNIPGKGTGGSLKQARVGSRLRPRDDGMIHGFVAAFRLVGLPRVDGRQSGFRAKTYPYQFSLIPFVSSNSTSGGSVINSGATGPPRNRCSILETSA
jgi:hypothetical protein